MKKTLLIITMFVLAAFTSKAQYQLTNPSFETSSGGSLTGWSLYFGRGSQISNGQVSLGGQAINATDGTHFILIESDSATTGQRIPALLGQNINYIDRPATMSFDYMFIRDTAGRDTMTAYVVLTKHNSTMPSQPTIIGQGTFYAPTMATTWTKGNITINYMASGSPDSVHVYFGTYNLNSTHPSISYGATVLLDNVKFAYNAGINEANKLQADVNVYPNPASTQVNLAYGLASSTNVDLDIYDMTGRVVMSLPQGNMTQGIHTINVNTSGLEKGIYVYRLTTNTNAVSGRIVISK